jgi:hypothetical protein
MASALYTDLKKGKHGSTFARPVEGLFGLRAWADDPALAPLLATPEVAEVVPTRPGSGRLASARSLNRSRSPDDASVPRARPLTPPKESPRPARDEAASASKRRRLAPTLDAAGIDSLLAAAEVLVTPSHRATAPPSVFAMQPCHAFAAPPPADGAAVAAPGAEALADSICAHLAATVSPPMLPAALWQYARACAAEGRTHEAEAAAARSFHVFATSAPWASLDSARTAFTQLTALQQP